MLGPQRYLLRLPGVAIWKIFEVLGGSVTYSSYQVEAITWIKSYRYLGLYVKKDASAWTESDKKKKGGSKSPNTPGSRSLTKRTRKGSRIQTRPVLSMMPLLPPPRIE